MKKILTVAYCILFLSNVKAQIPTTNLLGHYPFNGNALDASGNSQHGTVNGAALTADRNGILNSAYQFNGSSNYISLPTGIFTTLNLYTYSCWIKPMANTGGFAMCFGESSWGVCQTLAYQATGSITAGSYNSGGNPTQSLIHSTGTYSINQWIHIAMTRDLTSVKLYVNGVLQPGVPIPSTGGQNADYGTNLPLRAFIGARTLFNSYFNGAIDDVRIYGAALSQADITALYNENCFQSISMANTICSGNAATLTAIPAPSNTISWYSAPTASAAVGTGTVFTTPSITAAGVYTYYVGASTCTLLAQRVPVTITVNPTPTITVPSASICSGGLFGINPTGAFSYTYSNGQIVSPLVTTVYTVTGSSFQGCLASPATVTVTVNTTPSITVNSGFVCAGDSFTLTPSGGTSYTYSSGSPIVTPVTNTSYTVTGTNGNGCYGTAVANVGVVATPTLVISGSVSVCAGNSTTLSVSGANFYTWSNGANTPTLALSPATTTVYNVSGVNLFGCLSTKNVTVTVNPLPIVSVTSGSICSGKSFTMTASGASTYTYSSGTNIVSPLTNTSYSVTGTSALGCISSNTAVSTVVVGSLPSISVNSGSVCAGSAFTLIPAGGVSYTYSGGSAIVSPVTTSNYTVTGSGPNGCTATAVSNVAAVALPVVSITGANAVCNGNSIILTANGANTYSWNTGITTSTLSVSPAINTTYSVIGVALSGCSNTANKLITVNPLPVVSVNSGSICSGRSFTMIASGASTYTYSSGTNIVSPLTNTSYSVTGTSAQGCVSSNTAVSNVVVVTSPVISVNSGTICAGTSFTLVPSGGTSYTYSGGSAVVSPVTTTHYTITGVNAGGCTSTTVSTVIVNALPVVNISGPGAICNGSTAILTANGASSYVWNTGAFTSSISVSPSSNTIYSVSGLAANGCSNSAAYNLTVNALPIISVNSGTVCSGSNFTMVPSGAFTYTYSSGTNIVTPLTNTSYSVTGTSAQGCLSSNTAVSNVTVVALSLLTVNSGSLCAGTVFTMVPSGAITYTYSSGTSTVLPTASGSYTVRGTNAQGCISAPAIANVTVIALPVVTVNSGSICTGGVFTITPGGAINYSIAGGSNTVSPLSTTSYTVRGENAAGCISNVVTSTVTVNSLPVISVNSGSVCAGRIFTMAPTGASSYIYSNGSNTVIPTANASYTISGISAQGCPSSNSVVSSVTVVALPVISVNSGSVCAGSVFTMAPTGASTYTYSNGSSTIIPTVNSSYTVTGASPAGCISAPVISQVTVNALPLLSVTGPTVICFGESTVLNLVGAPNYTWTNNNVANSSIGITPATNTVYTAIGQTALGCTATISQAITVNTVPVISVSNASICMGDSHIFNPSGANSYTFSSGSATVNPVTNTNYTITGASLAGCVSTKTISIVVNPLPTVFVVGQTTICAGATATLSAAGGVNYLWSTNTSGATLVISPLITTTYSVTGTDSNGCAATETIQVVVNVPPTLTVNSGAICPGNSFTFTPSGAISYTYSSGSNIISPATTGTYSVSGTDANGCVSAVAIATVSVVNTLTVVVTGNTLICQGEPANLIAGGASNYVWSTSDLTSGILVTPLVTTNYTVMGTSGTCSDVAVITVSVNPTPTVTVNSGSVCVGSSFTLVPTGASTYVYSSGSAIVTPNSNMTYSVIGTDPNGCSDMAVSNVSVFMLPLISITSSSPADICEGESVFLVGSGAQSYLWSTGDTTSSVQLNPTVSTTYTLTGTNASGCSSQTSITQLVNICVGVEEKTNTSSHLEIYPNPSNGKFFVGYKKAGSILIENIEGKIIFSGKLNKDEITEINHNLKPGIYFCRILSDGNSVAVKKIIITD